MPTKTLSIEEMQKQKSQDLETLRMGFGVCIDTTPRYIDGAEIAQAFLTALHDAGGHDITEQTALRYLAKVLSEPVVVRPMKPKPEQWAPESHPGEAVIP